MEHVLADERFEIAVSVANPKLQDVDNTGIELVAEERADRLRSEWHAAKRPQSPRRHAVQDFLLREPTRRGSGSCIRLLPKTRGALR